MKISDRWRLELQGFKKCDHETRAEGFMVCVCININSYLQPGPLFQTHISNCLLDMFNECIKRNMSPLNH